MASMILPSIKCSDCGCNVEISALGDHVCVQTGYRKCQYLPSPALLHHANASYSPCAPITTSLRRVRIARPIVEARERTSPAD